MHADVCFQLSLKGSTLAEDRITISLKQVLNGAFGADLNGNSPESPPLLVYRCDQRTLVMQVLNSLDIISTYVGSSTPSREALIGKAVAQLSAVNFSSIQEFTTEQQKKTTFHGQDLSPDRIDAEFNQGFQKSSGASTWRRAASDSSHSFNSGSSTLNGAGKISGSLLGIASVDNRLKIDSSKTWHDGQSNSNSMSEEDVKNYANECGMEASFDGTRCVVKKLKVHVVNRANLNLSTLLV